MDIRKLLCILNKHYPFDGTCFLNYTKPHELLFATILSAQCTDNQVNKVTPMLFARCKSLEDFIAIETTELESIIRTTGFYKTKAANIKKSAARLVAEFGGEVPSGIDELTSLSGVGRKTANVVRGHVFKIPSIVVDTHVMRVSKRLGLVKSSEPAGIEFELMKILPQKNWIAFNQQIITHGREVCKARGAKCPDCVLGEFCDTKNIK